MTQQPQTATEPHSDAWSLGDVVDRVALRMFRVHVYGTLPESRYDTSARKQWDKVLNEDDRETWRRVARDLLVDLGTVSFEYEVRHPDGDLAVTRDDLGDAYDVQQQVWPDAAIRQRTVTRIYGEWSEVTE